MICDQEPEPRGIKISTRSENPVHRKTREFPGDVGQDIHGVRDDKQDRVGRGLSEGRDDVAEESDVPLEEVEPGLSGVLPSAGGDDAEIGSGGDFVVDGGGDSGAGEESGGVLEIEHLASELVGLGVDEGDLVGDVLGEDGLSDGHADVSDSDDGDLCAAVGGDGRVGVLDRFEKGVG